MSGLTELGQLLHEEHFRILVSICGLENRITGWPPPIRSTPAGRMTNSSSKMYPLWTTYSAIMPLKRPLSFRSSAAKAAVN